MLQKRNYPNFVFAAVTYQTHNIPGNFSALLLEIQINTVLDKVQYIKLKRKLRIMCDKNYLYNFELNFVNVKKAAFCHYSTTIFGRLRFFKKINPQQQKHLIFQLKFCGNLTCGTLKGTQ